MKTKGNIENMLWFSKRNHRTRVTGEAIKLKSPVARILKLHGTYDRRVLFPRQSLTDTDGRKHTLKELFIQSVLL